MHWQLGFLSQQEVAEGSNQTEYDANLTRKGYLRRVSGRIRCRVTKSDCHPRSRLSPSSLHLGVAGVVRTTPTPDIL